MRVGETFNDRFKVYDTTGALATADSTTITVTLPDGTTSNPTASEASTGVYDWSYTLTVAGRHEYVRRVVLGGVTRDSPPDVINVDDATTWAPLVDLAEARRFLNFDDPDDTSDDEELRRFIVAASGLVEDETRLWHRTTVVERVPAARSLFLSYEPVVSVTSVVQDSTTFPASGYVLSPGGAVVAATTGATPAWMLTTSASPVVVTYVAGETLVPPKVQEAVLETLKNHWESQRGAAGVPLFGGGEEQQLPPTASLGLPPRAQSLLARWLKTSGIA